MAGIPITGTLTPDGSFAVVDVAHVSGAELSGAATVAVAAIPDATTLVKGFATTSQVTRIGGITRLLEEFGAVGDCNPADGTGTDDTVAVQAALTWCTGAGKAVTGTPGRVYKVTAALNTWRTFVLGTKGDANSKWAFYRPSGSSGHFIVLGGLEPVPVYPNANSTFGYGSCWAATVAGFTVLGPANCGVDCVNVPYCLLDSYINIDVVGGFTGKAFACEREAPGSADWVTGYAARQGGYVIWCDVTLNSQRNNYQWGGGVYGYPANGVSIKGYTLASRWHGNFNVATAGTSYYFEKMPYDPTTGTSGFGSNAVIDGCINSGAIGVHSPYGGNCDVSQLHIENVTHSVLLDGTSTERIAGVIAINPPHADPVEVSYADVVFSVGGITPKVGDGCRNVVIAGGLSDYSSVCRQAIHLGPTYRSIVGGEFNPGAFSNFDPPNQILCDFNRWVAADGSDTNVAGTVGPTGYTYRGTKCGVGCADTTRTNGLRYCLLAADGSSGDLSYPVVNFPFQNLHLEQSDLGGFIFSSMHVKMHDGSSVVGKIQADVCPDTAGGRLGYLRHGIGAEFTIAGDNGFTICLISTIITQDMIDNGVILSIGTGAGLVDPSFYVAEPQGCLGYAAPRDYSHPGAHYVTGTQIHDGRISFWVDSIPVAATDPVFGQAFISGDRALLRSPVTADNHGRSMTLTGWEYSGSTWVPQYVIASSDAQAYADFTLQETDPSYAQGRFFVNSEGVPCVQMSPSVTAQLPEEILVRVKTDDGALADGTVVYASGGQGNNLLVKKLASGLTQLSSKLIGLTTEAVADTGRATSFGLVHGLDTLAYPAGTCLYTSGTAGVLSSTEPPGDVDGAAVCLVTRQHQNDGTVFVHPRTLDRLSGTTANRPVTPRKGTLYWDETVNSLMIWTGAAWALAIPAGYTDVSGTFDASTATADLTYEAFRDTPVRMPWLHRSQDDAISLHYQMPHNWTLTAVEPHVHIIQGAATGGDLVLDGRLAWSRSGITNLPAWASWTPFRVKTTLSATQWTHTMISLGTFTPPAGALYPSASLHVWLRRPGVADSEDTYEGDKVGGPTTAANVGLEYVDCHVQVQGFGTVTAT